MTKSALRSVLGIALVSVATSASATLTISLDTEFSGAADPAGTAPWLTAAFTTVSGGVNLTLTSLLQDPDELVSFWAFNLDPALDPTDLTFSYVSGSGTYAAPAISTGVNDFKADGDGYFDIRFLFSTSSGSTFGGTESGTWFISGINGLTENSFLFNSAPGGGNGTWTSAAHVQGIAAAPGSGWIGGNNEDPEDPGEVPEPASLALLGLGLAGLSMVRRRRV